MCDKHFDARIRLEVRRDGRGLQAHFHLLESRLGLFKESVDDAPGELSFFLIIVHLEDLFKRHWVDTVATFWKTGVSFFGL